MSGLGRAWTTSAFVTVCWAASGSAEAQNPDALATAYRTDFAVPDAPAFLLLDVDPSVVLRPTTVKEFSGAVSDFASSGNISLPRAFAVEFAPALLIGGKTLSLQKYRSNPALYRLRLSAATRRPENSASPTEIAVGLRVDLIDEADLRMNPEYLSLATDIAEKINDIYADARERAGKPPAPLELTSAEEDSIVHFQAPLTGLWENKKWNARVLELAAGLRAEAADSLGRNLRSTQAAAWGTFGTGFGMWGQLLLGGKISTVRDATTDEFSTEGGLAGRFYAGTNQYKFFAELGGTWRSGPDEWLLNGGGEVKLIRGGWVSFSAGLASTSNQTDLRTNLAVKLGALGF
ncbi:MAG: hypothetical protein ACREL3_04590 [Gemmatimonadales bacterium]